MNDETAIKVTGVSKAFKLPHEKLGTVKGLFVNMFRGKRTYEKQLVLKDISFEIKKGEFFGIVGRNGSGKSTLLKLLAGIYTPDEGHIQINGKLTPFIELGVGFSPELTGRENVFLNGALLGFNRKEMNAMYQDIVGFAEIENFMDQKLKNYSSGMQVRLAFSIAIRANSDILVLDEVLAVGDEAFQQKCYDYFGNLKREGKTVVLVTHDMGTVERFCRRGILIEEGGIRKTGTNIEIAEMYRNLFLQQIKDANKKENINKQENLSKKMDDPVCISSIKIHQGGEEISVLKPFQPFDIEIIFKAKKNLGRSVCGLNIINSQNILVVATGTGTIYDDPLVINKGKNKITFTIEENIYNQDSYYVNIALAQGIDDSQKLLIKETEAVKFSIQGIKNRKHSLTHPNIKVRVS